MDRIGPLYCETAYPLLVAEPVNTITNLVILLAAFFAFRAARGRLTLDVGILLTLLTINGVGSFLWHGTRLAWTLPLDFIPGLLFLLFFVYAWMRRLYGPIAGLVGLLVFLGTTWAATNFPYPAPFLLPVFASTFLLGLVYVGITWRATNSAVARYATLMLFAALTAAFFRTIDLSTCAVIPFGTHFLWHIFLSVAAYMAIVLLVRMQSASKSALFHTIKCA